MTHATTFHQPPAAPTPPRTSGLAIAALVTGIASLVLACLGVGALVGVVAIGLGILALSKVKGDPDTTGKGLAWGGIGTGAAAVVLGIVLSVFMFFALQGAREAARQSMANSNLRFLSLAANTYSMDHKAELPDHPDDLQDYINRDYTLYYAPSSDQTGPPTVTVLAENERETFYRVGDVAFIGRKEGFGRLSSFMIIVGEPMFFTLYRPKSASGASATSTATLKPRKRRHSAKSSPIASTPRSWTSGRSGSKSPG